jgi:hypothetical protein
MTATRILLIIRLTATFFISLSQKSSLTATWMHPKNRRLISYNFIDE